MLGTISLRAGDARRAGMPMDEIVNLVTEIGDWLADDAEPRTYEQRLLKELWRHSDAEAKRMLSRSLIEVARDSQR